MNYLSESYRPYRLKRANSGHTLRGVVDQCFGGVYKLSFDTNNLTVGRNSEKINGTAADLTVSVERAAFTLVYTDGTQGWLLKDK